MKSVNRKIRDLEDKVFKKPELGTSKIFISDPAEQALQTAAEEILKTDPEAYITDLTTEQQQIVDRATHLIWFRAIDIFRSGVGGCLCQGSKTLQLVFDMWLTYFLDEATIGLTQMRLEEKIMDQKGKSWKKKEKELAEVFGPNSEKWVHVFTRERFEKFIADFIERGAKAKALKKRKKRRKKKEKVTA